MEILIYIATAIVAYLIGSFSTAVWFGKWFHDVDVRQQGSGNAGATNTIRVLGTQAGIIVLLIDVLKGWSAVALAGLVIEYVPEMPDILFVQIAASLAVVVGHIFPLYTRFKGGKGIATMLGVIIALFPWQLIIVEVILFAVVFLLTRFVSLGSIVVAIALPIFSIWLFNVSIILEVMSGLIAVVVPVTHRNNVRRLIKGRESKISFEK